MKEIKVTPREEGQRFDHFLKKLLKEASTSFLYKQLRHKNITLNDKKATGSEKIAAGDSIKIWFSDETYEKFVGVQAVGAGSAAGRGNSGKSGNGTNVTGGRNTNGRDVSRDGGALAGAKWKSLKPFIVYEDDQIILINKPSGMLSQRADIKDVSLVEYLTEYLLESGQLTTEDLRTFKPAICNRLDRNTSGLVAAGKTITALQQLTEAFRDRTIHKYYRCLIGGNMKVDADQTYGRNVTGASHYGVWETITLDGYLLKNEKTNQVQILDKPMEGADRIVTKYTPLQSGDAVTDLEVELITGKSHQIRAHLSSIGHPLIGDPKYGDFKLNKEYRDRFGVRSQMLHSARMIMPENLTGALEHLAGKEFTAPLPAEYKRVLRWAGMKED